MKFIKLVVQEDDIRFVSLDSIGEILFHFGHKYFVKLFNKNCDSLIYLVETSNESAREFLNWLDNGLNNTFNLKVFTIKS